MKQIQSNIIRLHVVDYDLTHRLHKHEFEKRVEKQIHKEQHLLSHEPDGGCEGHIDIDLHSKY